MRGPIVAKASRGVAQDEVLPQGKQYTGMPLSFYNAINYVSHGLSLRRKEKSQNASVPGDAHTYESLQVT